MSDLQDHHQLLSIYSVLKTKDRQWLLENYTDRICEGATLAAQEHTWWSQRANSIARKHLIYSILACLVIFLYGPIRVWITGNTSMMIIDIFVIAAWFVMMVGVLGLSATPRIEADIAQLEAQGHPYMSYEQAQCWLELNNQTIALKSGVTDEHYRWDQALLTLSAHRHNITLEKVR